MLLHVLLCASVTAGPVLGWPTASASAGPYLVTPPPPAFPRPRLATAQPELAGRPGTANCTTHFLAQPVTHFTFPSTLRGGGSSGGSSGRTYQQRYFVCVPKGCSMDAGDRDWNGALCLSWGGGRIQGPTQYPRPRTRARPTHSLLLHGQ